MDSKLITTIFGLLTTAASLLGQGAQLNNPGFVASLKPASSSAAYSYTATAFDSADRITHSGDYTSVANSKLFTMSFWFKLSNAAENGVDRTLYRSGGDVFLLQVEDGSHSGSSVANGMYFIAEDSGFASPLRFVVTSPTFTSGSTWHHFAMSVDMADTGKRWIYIDGSAATVTWLTYNNLALYFANGGDSTMMAKADGSEPCTGSLSEVWIAAGQYMDLSVSSNLEKFRSSGGKPVSLGSDGSTPTGTAPTVYLKNGFATFQNNLGSGGNFTVTGTLADDASIP